MNNPTDPNALADRLERCDCNNERIEANIKEMALERDKAEAECDELKRKLALDPFNIREENAKLRAKVDERDKRIAELEARFRWLFLDRPDDIVDAVALIMEADPPPFSVMGQYLMTMADMDRAEHDTIPKLEAERDALKEKVLAWEPVIREIANQKDNNIIVLHHHDECVPAALEKL